MVQSDLNSESVNAISLSMSQPSDRLCLLLTVLQFRITYSPASCADCELYKGSLSSFFLHISSLCLA